LCAASSASEINLQVPYWMISPLARPSSNPFGSDMEELSNLFSRSTTSSPAPPEDCIVSGRLAGAHQLILVKCIFGCFWHSHCPPLLSLGLRWISATSAVSMESNNELEPKRQDSIRDLQPAASRVGAMKALFRSPWGLVVLNCRPMVTSVIFRGLQTSCPAASRSSAG